MLPRFDFFIDGELVFSLNVSGDRTIVEASTEPCVIISGYLDRSSDNDIYTVTLKNYQGRYVDFEEKMMRLVTAVRNGRKCTLNIVNSSGVVVKVKEIQNVVYSLGFADGDIMELCNIS